MSELSRLRGSEGYGVHADEKPPPGFPGGGVRFGAKVRSTE